MLAKLLNVKHPGAVKFGEFYGTALPIDSTIFGKECALVPLPHQPTYDHANKYSVYGRNEVGRRLANIE